MNTLYGLKISNLVAKILYKYIFSKLKALKIYSHGIIHIYKDKNLILIEKNVYKNQSLIINVATMDLVSDIASICNERLVKAVACSSNIEHS